MCANDVVGESAIYYPPYGAENSIFECAYPFAIHIHGRSGKLEGMWY
jgi:hypothetical protein